MDEEAKESDFNEHESKKEGAVTGTTEKERSRAESRRVM